MRALPARHGREAERHGEHAFLEQLAAELLRQRRFAQHDRRDGRGARPVSKPSAVISSLK